MELEALKTKLANGPRRLARDRSVERSLASLAKTGEPEALATVADLARDQSSSSALRTRAIDTLRLAGPPAAPYIRVLLEEGLVDPALPWALAETGSAEDAALLVPLLKRRGLRLRVNATVALDYLDAPAEHEGFRIALRDRRLFVRASAMSALQDRCSDSELVEALESARKDVPWYRLLTRRYFKLWARAPGARDAHRRKVGLS